MHLKKVSLFNFKNYNEASISFSEGANCFIGPNGSGKTNLLDAIYYLSLTKSAFNSIDSQNIRHDEKFFSIKGIFEKKTKVYEVLCSLKAGQKKVVKTNKAEYEKLSNHIGEFPVVLIAPDDTDIIKDGSEARRKFFDGILSQIDSQYLKDLLQYKHYLKQRNSLLKRFSENNSFDADLIAPYDHKILSIGKNIFEKRVLFIEQFLPLFSSHYQQLVEGKESVNIVYRSDFFTDGFTEVFINHQKRDILMQRTSKGVHKDDYLFSIGSRGLKKFGSQGQQKSFLIALKLTQFEIIKLKKGNAPLLLLDDIFDKLDDHRIEKLMEMVASKKFGQIFITEANSERVIEVFKKITMPVRTFDVMLGTVNQVQ